MEILPDHHWFPGNDRGINLKTKLAVANRRRCLHWPYDILYRSSLDANVAIAQARHGDGGNVDDDTVRFCLLDVVWIIKVSRIVLLTNLLNLVCKRRNKIHCHIAGASTGRPAVFRTGVPRIAQVVPKCAYRDIGHAVDEIVRAAF